MTHGAQTEFERLRQTNSNRALNVLDLFAVAYLSALNDRVPFAPDARTLREAVEGAEAHVVCAASAEAAAFAWKWLAGYLPHARLEELEQNEIFNELYEFLLRLWGE